MNISAASHHVLIAAITELSDAWVEDLELPGEPAQQRLYQHLIFALEAQHGLQMSVVRVPGDLGLYFPLYPTNYDTTTLEFQFARASITGKAIGPEYARQLAATIDAG